MFDWSSGGSVNSKLMIGAVIIGILFALIYIFRHNLPMLGPQASHVHFSPSFEGVQEQDAVVETIELVSSKEQSTTVETAVSPQTTKGTEIVTENYVGQSLRLAREDPNYVNSLFAEYLSLDSINDRRRIASRVAAIAALSESGEQAERYIVEKILGERNVDQPRWAELLGEVGVRSYESRQMLIDSIPWITDSNTLENVIKAVLPVESTSEEKFVVVSQLKPFVEHEDAKIRAAAVRGVSMWGNEDNIDVLESGLQDTSNDVRHAAAAAAMMSDLRSNTVKTGLLQLLSNKSEPADTREQAYYGLLNYELNSQEQEMVKQWESLH